MADKQKAALNRLSKKLSALRATLPKDERILLDRIVLGTNQVEGHKMTTDAAQGARNRAVSGAASGAKKVSEVTAHGMVTGAASGAAAGAKAVKKVSEVTAHGMVMGAASGAKASKTAQGAASAAKAAVSGAANVGALLEFDATAGGYRVSDGAAI